VPVGIRFPQGEIREGWGRIVNLNASGLLMESRFRLRVADVVYVSFLLKEGLKFDNLRAHVIRASYEDGYYVAGIAFDEVVDKDTLRDVINALASEGGLAFE
jgi:hypothetical protein